MRPQITHFKPYWILLKTGYETNLISRDILRLRYWKFCPHNIISKEKETEKLISREINFNNIKKEIVLHLFYFVFMTNQTESIIQISKKASNHSCMYFGLVAKNRTLLRFFFSKRKKKHSETCVCWSPLSLFKFLSF